MPARDNAVRGFIEEKCAATYRALQLECVRTIFNVREARKDELAMVSRCSLR